MPALFIGSHPALDFLNTVYLPGEEQVEMLVDGRALLAWLVEAKFLDEAAATKLQRRFGSKAFDVAAATARKVREWARSWLTRWRAAPKADYREDIAVLNRLLARGASRHEIIATDQGLRVVERAQFDSADAVLTPILVQLAMLVSEEDPSLVRSCAGDKCTLWFLDRTKAHRRMFCSASACGNRAKVAAFRRRQREAE